MPIPETKRLSLFDPATFNREVWRHNSSITLNGQAIGNLESLVTGPQKHSWADIEQAVEAGALEWHGNSVWEPGSRVYRPGTQVTDAERGRDIQRALTILNDSTRSLIERAHAIADVPGFGLGTSTGLLLLTHPTEFALYNRQSIAALKRLKLPTQPLEAFEEAAHRHATSWASMISLSWTCSCIASPIENGTKEKILHPSSHRRQSTSAQLSTMQATEGPSGG